MVVSANKGFSPPADRWLAFVKLLQLSVCRVPSPGYTFQLFTVINRIQIQGQSWLLLTFSLKSYCLCLDMELK